MTLFGNIHYCSSEVFLLAKENPKEFERFIEADNMITLCAAIENAYNVEMFLMREVEGCYISSAENVRERLSWNLFCVNVGTSKHISINFDIFKRALKTLKKLEGLVDPTHDGSRRERNKIGIAWKLGAWVNFNHLEETKTRFDFKNLSSEQAFKIMLHHTERLSKARKKMLNKEDISLPETETIGTSISQGVKIFFAHEDQFAQPKAKSPSSFLKQRLDCFFKSSAEHMQTLSNKVFAIGNGFFKRVYAEGFVFELKNNEACLSLRFDGRRDVGPRGVFFILHSNIKKLYITERERKERNDVYELLFGGSFLARHAIRLNRPVICKTICMLDDRKGFFNTITKQRSVITGRIVSIQRPPIHLGGIEAILGRREANSEESELANIRIQLFRAQVQLDETSWES